MKSFKEAVISYFASVKLFSRNARLYLLGLFLIGLNHSVYMLLFNLYLKESGFMESQIGLVNSFRAAGLALIAIPAAILLSRVKLKAILITSCFLFALFSVALTSTGDLSIMEGAGLLTGMAFAIFRIAAGPFYMRNSTPVERTHLFSFSFAMFLSASMVASFGAGKLVTMIGTPGGDPITGYRMVLYLAIGLGLLAIIPFWMIKAAPPSKEENRIKINFHQLRVRGGFYIKITLANFMIGAGAGLIIPFLNLYFRDRFGMPPDKIGYYYVLLSIGMLAGTLSGPLMTPRLGLIRTVVVTQLASIPFMLILSYSYWLPLVVPAFILRGGLMNIGVPISTNFAMELSDKEEHGLVNALLTISWTSSWTISVALGGNLIEQFGYTLVLNISIVIYLVSSLYYYFMFAGSERRDRNRGWYLIPKVKA